jgi:nucleoside-diphosphate-sugar epimerase
MISSLDVAGELRQAMNGAQSVVHLAARVHVMNETAPNALSEFRRVNVAGTMNVARAAVAAGARRFVFVSSIKVNGEYTLPGKPYTAESLPDPVDAYGISKYEAERELHGLAAQTGMELVVIRPVLVYGPGVKGNFLSMMKWIRKGLPLPFGAARNRRSLVSVQNLVSLIEACLSSPAAANETFLVSDGEDLSTPELIRRIGAAMHRRAVLLPVPLPLLGAVARAVGKEEVARRILGSLQVDIGKTRELLGWNPSVTVTDALRLTVSHFLAS